MHTVISVFSLCLFMEKILFVKCFPVKALAKQAFITVIQIKGHFYRTTSPYIVSDNSQTASQQ